MKRVILFVFLFAGTLPARTSAQLAMTRYAGTSAAGYSGDGGPATAATLSRTVTLALGLNKTLYISSESVIRAVDSNGIITTIAGTGTAGYSGDGGPATAAMVGFYCPIVLDETGTFLYIVETNGCVIRKVNLTTGIITTIAGLVYNCGDLGDGGPATAARITYPGTAAWNYTRHSLLILGGITPMSGDSILPGGLRMREILPSGIIRTIAGTGTGGYSGDGGPATAARILGGPALLEWHGNIYFQDASMTMRRIDSSGIITTIAGIHDTQAYAGDGGPATAAKFIGAAQLVADSCNVLIWPEFGGNRKIRKLNLATGIIDSVGSMSVIGYGIAQTQERSGTVLYVADGYSAVWKVFIPADHAICPDRTEISDIPTVQQVSTVYPNPVRRGGMLYFDHPLSGMYQIYDALGRMISEGTLKNELRAPEIPGIYALLTRTNDGIVSGQSVFIVH